jgi:hypothetical protein
MSTSVDFDAGSDFRWLGPPSNRVHISDWSRLTSDSTWRSNDEPPLSAREARQLGLVGVEHRGQLGGDEFASYAAADSARGR